MLITMMVLTGKGYLHLAKDDILEVHGEAHVVHVFVRIGKPFDLSRFN